MHVSPQCNAARTSVEGLFSRVRLRARLDLLSRLADLDRPDGSELLMRGRGRRLGGRVAGQTATNAAASGTGQANARARPRHADHDLDEDIGGYLQRATGVEMAGLVEREIP